MTGNWMTSYFYININELCVHLFDIQAELIFIGVKFCCYYLVIFVY